MNRRFARPWQGLPYQSDQSRAARGSPMTRARSFMLRRPWILVAALLFLSLLVYVFTAPNSAQPAHLQCLAFVQTVRGEINGYGHTMRECDFVIGYRRKRSKRTASGGYCICQGNLAVRAQGQRWRTVTCTALCDTSDARVALPIPDDSSCPAGTPPFFPDGNVPGTVITPPPRASIPTAPPDDLSIFWDRIMGSVTARDEVVVPPGMRTRDDDFVAKGLRVSAPHLEIARLQWKAFMALAGPYPRSMFQGRGIAILGGEVEYLVPALLAIKMIRRSGCTLPIELWFPADEIVTGPLLQKIDSLGAHVCSFPVDAALGKGFYMKAAMLALSSFQEVLMLDADQVPVWDVTELFEDPDYVRTGALLWPDFWDASWAPDAPAALGLPASRLPTGTFESGQLLFDKARTWPAIVSALHFNLNTHYYYPLFSNYMGQGDKESFPLALLAHSIPFHTVSHPVASLGTWHRVCSRLRCWHDYITNTMIQHTGAGHVAFLHTNMRPKPELQFTSDKQYYLRRWRVANPGTSARYQDWATLGLEAVGFDAEMVVHSLLLSLRCDEDMHALWEQAQAAQQSKVALDAPPVNLPRLPFVPEGINLMNTYEALFEREGQRCRTTALTGTFLNDQPVSSWQAFLHWRSSKRMGMRHAREDTMRQPRTSLVITRARLWEQQKSQAAGKGPRLIGP